MDCNLSFENIGAVITSSNIESTLTANSKLDFVYGDAAKMEVEKAITYIQSGSVEVTKAVTQARNELDNKVDIAVSSAQTAINKANEASLDAAKAASSSEDAAGSAEYAAISKDEAVQAANIATNSASNAALSADSAANSADLASGYAAGINPSQFVTINSEQTVLGDKTFSGNVKVADRAAGSNDEYAANTKFVTTALDDYVTINTIQNITGSKAFDGMLYKDSTTIDIDTNPTTQINNQIWFRDRNDNGYAVVQANQNTTGALDFSFTGKARTANEFCSIGVRQYVDGVSVSFIPEPSEAVATGTGYAQIVSQAATLTWVRNRTSFAGQANRINLSWALNTAYTMPADGLLAVTVQVGSQINSTVTLQLGNSSSNGINIIHAGHNGAANENNKIPLIFPVRKGQVYFLNWNSAGNASVINAYLWKYPSQGV